MLGIQTRLRLAMEQDATLVAFLITVSTTARQAYQHVARGELSAGRKDVYAWSTKQGLTSHQAKSVAAQVEQWRATDQAVLDHRIETLRLRIDALEGVVKTLDLQIKASKQAAGKFLTPGAKTRLKDKRFHKHRSLASKLQQLEGLEAQRKSGNFSRVFGSRRLLAQRHRLDETKSPWTMETWRQEWERKRQGSFTLIGDASHTGGNQSAQIVLETTQTEGREVPTGKATLHLRLTEYQAQLNLSTAALTLGVPVEKLPNRMSYKRLVLPVEFSPQQSAKLYEAQRLGLPITVSLSKKPTPKGKVQQRAFSRAPTRKARKNSTQSSSLSPAKLPEIAIYLHVAFDLPPAPIVASRRLGCLGIDLNSWGLSYAAVDAQGQLLKVSDDTGKTFSLKGDVVLPLRGKTTDQAKHLIRQAVVELVELAEKHRLAISIEGLNFAKKKARLREMPTSYARMLSKLATNGFSETLISRCRKVGVALHKVSPAWTSVAGFAKYGMSLGLSVDQAGAFAIGRAGVLAKGQDTNIPTHSKNGKKLSPKFVRQLAEKQATRVLYYSESVGFAKPFPIQHQRMLGGQGGLTWRSVRKALGQRATWPQKWSRQTPPATQASVQEVLTSRPGGKISPWGLRQASEATSDLATTPVKGVAETPTLTYQHIK